MNNEKLYQLCKNYGTAALEARRKFAGLLPEVYKRRLYVEKGFGSIFEFAAKLAGMSKEQVQRVIQLEQKFEDKPVLKEMLVNGEESIHKLARVASVATPKTQVFWAEKIKVLPKKAIETLVKDIRREEQSNFQNELQVQTQDGLHQALTKDNPVPGHRLKLDEDIENELAELQEKGIDVNEFLRECLKKRKLEITEEKEQLSQEAKPTKSTYIKVKIKKIIQEEHGTKCSIPGCNRPAADLHHTRRFSISQTHDPKYLAPLCKEHHQIAHAVDTKVGKYRTKGVHGRPKGAQNMAQYPSQNRPILNRNSS